MTIYSNEDSNDLQRNYQPYKKKFDSMLYVISCIFSPFGQDIRTKLAQEYIERLEKLKKRGFPVQVCVIEMLYPNQESFIVVNDKHFYRQIRYEHEGIYLFNKENLINVAVQEMLPTDWKYMAWIDADIEFKNPLWSIKTIEKFEKERCDIIQLFSVCRNLDKDGLPSEYFHSSIKTHYDKNFKKKYGHPGYAWACTRRAYDKMRGLFEFAIVGGGDSIMSFCLLDKVKTLEKLYEGNPNFIAAIHKFYKKVEGFHVGYLDVVIVHYYHGERKNRMYHTRRSIIIDSLYLPKRDLMKPFEEFGLLIPTKEFYDKISNGITKYFHTRKEIG
jgi:glycosyltransferase involved in cell wall biosynthesis